MNEKFLLFYRFIISVRISSMQYHDMAGVVRLMHVMSTKHIRCGRFDAIFGSIREFSSMVWKSVSIQRGLGVLHVNPDDRGNIIHRNHGRKSINSILKGERDCLVRLELNSILPVECHETECWMNQGKLY